MSPVKSPWPWLHKIRLRVLAYALGLVLAALAISSAFTIPAWPFVGVAVAAVVLVINRTASKLADHTCLGCGRDIADLPIGEHGKICPDCGAISVKADMVASHEPRDPRESDDHDDAESV
jgi:hypothetical protein